MGQRASASEISKKKVRHIKEQKRQSSNHQAILAGLLVLGTVCACSKSTMMVYYTPCTMKAGSVHTNPLSHPVLVTLQKIISKH